jgi:N-methylhydantoinase A
MSNAIREVSVRKGYDPRDSMFVAYGGTLPLFAWQIANAVGIDEVLIPADSSVFCAEGLLASDFALRRDRSVSWSLADIEGLDAVNLLLDEIVESALDDMADDGFDRNQLSVKRVADLKYPGQVFELSMPLPDRLEPEGVHQLVGEFDALYERTYGTGTAWAGTPPSMHVFTVTVSARRNGSTPVARRHVDIDRRAVPTVRKVFLPSTKRFEDVDVIPDSQFEPGADRVGPLIIDAVDTTIFVPPGVQISRDELMSYRLTEKGS